MMHNNTFSRREFGSIAAAGFVCAATGMKSGTGNLFPDSVSREDVSFSPVAAVARELISAGEIGSVHLGCSSTGDCNGVKDIHEKQLLLLCEILQLGQADMMHSIAIPTSFGSTDCFRTLMTTLVFSSGIRVEVTSTSDSINTTGCLIRGDCGSIHILEDHITVVSNENHIQKEVYFHADGVKTQLQQQQTNRYTALVHEVMYDAQKRLSV